MERNYAFHNPKREFCLVLVCKNFPFGGIQVGTGVTNALINTRKAFDKSFAAEAEDVPVISTSVAYGVYMAVSSNLR